MKVLFASSEIFPYAKTGGLADVAQALPQALSKEIEIISVMPLYGFMSPSAFVKESFNFTIILGGIYYDITLYSTENKNITTYFIAAPLLSTTESLYHNEDGEYANNDLRFGIFCAGVVELAQHLNIELIHLNDWHSALVALFIKKRALPIKTVFTIHNLAYQGLFHASSLQRLGIDSHYFTMEGIEFYGSLNFMKAGIAYSNRVTTVSPQYAKEILTKQFGCGLEGFLELHNDKLSGILNGIDGLFFNPKDDKALAYNYDINDIASKYLNKKALIKEVGLKDPRKPLFVMISRLVHQKGFDLLLQVLPTMLKKRLNFLLLVDGTSPYQEPLQKLAKAHENFVLIHGYDENLSHRIYAGGDFLLMPSLYEPCGLNQMIAMRYGTIPFVHGVGGLFDSVHEKTSACGQGIVFTKPTKKAFLDALERALKLKSDTMNIKKMIHFDMKCDFSFDISAKSYLQLYKAVLLSKETHV